MLYSIDTVEWEGGKDAYTVILYTYILYNSDNGWVWTKQVGREDIDWSHSNTDTSGVIDSTAAAAGGKNDVFLFSYLL